MISNKIISVTIITITIFTALVSIRLLLCYQVNEMIGNDGVYKFLFIKQFCISRFRNMNLALNF